MLSLHTLKVHPQGRPAFRGVIPEPPETQNPSFLPFESSHD